MPRMDPSAFREEDCLQDLFAPGPTEEPIPVVSRVPEPTEPIITPIAFEVRSVDPTPFKPTQEVPNTSKPEPMQTEESGVPEQV